MDSEQTSLNVTSLAENQKIPILVFGLTCPGLDPRSTTFVAGTLTTTPSMRLCIDQETKSHPIVQSLWVFG